jgi:predicted transcriptional regulator
MSLKNRSQFSSTLDNDLKKRLKDLSDETKVPISKLLDESVELLLRHRATRDSNVRNITKQEDVFYVDINMDDK